MAYIMEDAKITPSVLQVEVRDETCGNPPTLDGHITINLAVLLGVVRSLSSSSKSGGHCNTVLLSKTLAIAI